MEYGNVAQIFKKGSNLLVVNYHPLFLTGITCKRFQHTICMHILSHLEDHTILTNPQHGFRSGRCCEIKLVTTFHVYQMHNKKGSQIDISDLDFSKAFDMIPHASIHTKLKHNDIDDRIRKYIYNFIYKNRKEIVVAIKPY